MNLYIHSIVYSLLYIILQNLLSATNRNILQQEYESLEEEASQRISEIVYLKIENQKRYQRVQTLGNSQSTTQQYTSIYSEIRILKNKQTKTEPRNLINRNLIKLMNRNYIKGNHYQAMPIQQNNLSCKPKEITIKNNEQKETEKRKPVSEKEVSESAETGPLTTQ
ncbi:Hypothetical_protein [Hexamita inflata]|uniref:Hypothetical_protein n=1 Tax=Hexamita inflata TaxID=28002 RepID=A0AA86RDB5_9EUKA|nr:Hypothetical protein HINF_LOCUS63486 [Hexamita inflata]